MSNDMMKLMTMNVNVGINEVVSVFVAKYEDGLFAKKKELSDKIREVKSELTKLIKSIEDSIDQSNYVTIIPVLGIRSEVSSVSVMIEGNYYSKIPRIEIKVGLFSINQDNKYPEFTKEYNFPISKEDVGLNVSLKIELESLNTELMEVMSQIKSVSRKERQIRGKISEMKLEESGYTEMLNNPEMLKLVEL